MTWSIPPSMLRWLPEVPADRAVAVLLRHSVRPPLTLSDADYTLPLTADGAELARRLGALLGTRVRSLHTSPLSRCLQTAEMLREGAAASCDILRDHALGDPGVYVIDAAMAHRTWLEHGHEHVMACLVCGEEALPGLADPEIAARRLVRHMIEPERDPGLHVFVTHDSLVTATAARALGRALGKDHWPLYLEAAFFWRGASGVCVAYRDHLEVRAW